MTTNKKPAPGGTGTGSRTAFDSQHFTGRADRPLSGSADNFLSPPDQLKRTGLVRGQHAERAK